MPALKHRQFKGKKSKPKVEKDSDIVGKTASRKEVTRGERNKAISDFKKMKEKNLANFTRPSSKAGMSNKKASSSKKPIGSSGKKYNVGVSKGGVSFKEAFRHFRNKGDKTFTWNGKKYTTELKK